MKKKGINKKQILYILSTVLLLGAGFAVAIVLLKIRQPKYDKLWEQYIASDRNEALLKDIHVFHLVTTIYIMTPIASAFVMSRIVDFFFGKTIINRYSVTLFILSTVFSTVLIVLTYVFRNPLANTLFSAIWNHVLILGLVFLSTPFKKRKSLPCNDIEGDEK